MKKKSFLFFLFGTLLVVLLPGWIVMFYDDTIALWKDADSYVWHAKMNKLLHGGLQDTEVLILGDSQTMSGILPDILEKSIGRKVYNFGLPAQQPEGLESLAALLKSNLPGGRTLLININPYCMFKSEVYEAFLTYYRGELLNHSLRTLLYRPDLAGKSAGQYLHQALLTLPIYSFHVTMEPYLSMGEDVGYFQKGWSPISRLKTMEEKNTIVANVMEQNAGFWTWKDYKSITLKCSSTSLPAVSVRGIPYPDRRGAKNSWRRLLQQLSGSGYRIVIIQIPFSDVWGASTDRSSVYARLDAEILAMSAGMRNVAVIDRPPQREYEERGMFHDWTHLSPCGAAKYTSWLGRKLSDEK